MTKFRSFIEGLLVGIIVLIPAIMIVGNRIDIQLYAYDYTNPHIYIMNRETQSTTYQKSMNSKISPGSLTQIMTAIVALEESDDLTETVSIDNKTYNAMAAADFPMAGFTPDEVVTYEDLLYGMMFSSGGETANSIAIHTSGDVNSFVQLMNQKATELHLKDTHFTNPEGRHHQEQYTTASDVAALLDYALENPQFKTIFTAETYKSSSTVEHPNGIELYSPVFKQLESEVQEGFKIIGGKSSITGKAGQSWVTVGLIKNQEYLTITMGAPIKEHEDLNKGQLNDTLHLYKVTQSITEE